MQQVTAETRAPSRNGCGNDAGKFERRYLLLRFWRSARGFWGRQGTPLAWILSAALLLIVLLNLAASYGMNVWHRFVFDALQERDSSTVLLLSGLYLPLLAGSSRRRPSSSRWRGRPIRRSRPSSNTSRRRDA